MPARVGNVVAGVAARQLVAAAFDHHAKRHQHFAVSKVSATRPGDEMIAELAAPALEAKCMLHDFELVAGQHASPFRAASSMLHLQCADGDCVTAKAFHLQEVSRSLQHQPRDFEVAGAELVKRLDAVKTVLIDRLRQLRQGDAHLLAPRLVLSGTKHGQLVPLSECVSSNTTQCGNTNCSTG